MRHPDRLPTIPPRRPIIKIYFEYSKAAIRNFFWPLFWRLLDQRAVIRVGFFFSFFFGIVIFANQSVTTRSLDFPFIFLTKMTKKSHRNSRNLLRRSIPPITVSDMEETVQSPSEGGAPREGSMVRHGGPGSRGAARSPASGAPAGCGGRGRTLPPSAPKEEEWGVLRKCEREREST